MRRVVGRLLAKAALVYFCLALVAVNAGHAQDTTVKDWLVPGFGVFKVPQELNAADIMGLFKQLEAQHQDKVPKDKLQTMGQDRKELLNQIDFGLYQLTLEEGNAFYQAGMVLIKEKKPSAQTRQFWDGPTNITQKVNIIKFHDTIVRQMDQFITDLEQIANKESKVALTFKLLERPPLEFTEVNGKLAAATSMRMLIKYGDFIYPFYGKVYIFTVDECLAAMVVVTSDSERLFWEPKFADTIKTLEPMKK